MFFSISLCVPIILQPVWESGTFLEAKSQICTGNSPNGNGNVAMSFGFMKGTVCINEGLNGGFVNFRLQEAQSTREIWPGVNCRILQIAYQTRKSQLFLRSDFGCFVVFSVWGNSDWFNPFDIPGL